MSTIWLWVAGGVFCLIILGMIPGIKEVIKPVIGLLTSAIEETFKLGFGYLVWTIKAIFQAHTDLITHLRYRREHFRPEEKAEENSQGE